MLLEYIADDVFSESGTSSAFSVLSEYIADDVFSESGTGSAFSVLSEYIADDVIGKAELVPLFLCCRSISLMMLLGKRNWFRFFCAIGVYR